MTRINVVEPRVLSDQHLLAEHRELTRIPNTIVSCKAKVDFKKIPKDYVLGAGHCTFFYDKLLFLYNRYDQIHDECLKRKFNVSKKFPSIPEYLICLWNEYTPTKHAININVERIIDRASTSLMRYNGSVITTTDYIDLLNNGEFKNVK